jgi:hypothetical protein
LKAEGGRLNVFLDNSTSNLKTLSDKLKASEGFPLTNADFKGFDLIPPRDIENCQNENAPGMGLARY